MQLSSGGVQPVRTVVVNQDISVYFKSRELSFKCWINCYSFKVESLRTHTKQPLSMEIASDFLDNLETNFSEFSVKDNTTLKSI